MEVHCEGCAGCCLDWRPLLDEREGRDGESDSGGATGPAAGGADDSVVDADVPDTDVATGADAAGASAGRRSAYEPLDDVYNFAPLTREEVRTFLDDGLADALIPRFWTAPDDPAREVEVGDHRVAAVGGKPVFFVGLRKPPKPVAPFGLADERWLPACVFLDPTTLQCRVHGGEHFPEECATYPSSTLALDRETECERVEEAFGGDRLLDDEPDDVDGPLFGPGALGSKLFCYPWPDEIDGLVARAAAGELTDEDRAECLAVAAASSPGTTAVSEHHYEAAKSDLLEGDATDSWVGAAIAEWERRRDREPPRATVADDVEVARGAPETPGWDAVREGNASDTGGEGRNADGD